MRTSTRAGRLGPTAWSIMHRGAVFQHIHRVPHRSPDAVLCTKTRSAALLGVSLDASTMLGSVGQCGWIQRVGGKASSFRDTAEAVLYLHPSESCSGQLVFVLRKMCICVVRAVILCLEPDACALLLAASTLHAQWCHGPPTSG